MKTSKTIERTRNAKIKYINKYFEFFKFKKDIIKSLYNILESFETCNIFIKYILQNYKVTACGKHTRLFWTERGYTLDEANNLRKQYIYKRNPEDSPMNINFWVNKGLTEVEAIFKIKSQRKLNIEYWLCKGYNESDAKIKVSQFQNEQNAKFQKNKKNNPEKYKFSNSLTIEYWENKGYSNSEAKTKLIERQKTFSLEKCINKYGKELGTIKWQERQNKWQNTLINNSLYDGHTGKSVPLLYKINNFDTIKLINSISFKNKLEIYNIIVSCNSIEDVINKYVDIIKTENDVTFFKAMRPLLHTTFFKIYYNTTKEHIYSLIIPKLSFLPTKYGNIRWYNNHICRSDGEYTIAHFLVSNNIKYIYEKSYNIGIINKMRCDFYLIDYDYYIEYTGMKSKSYDYKKTFLSINNINNIYYSNNIDNIKQFILNLNNENNNIGIS